MNILKRGIYLIIFCLPLYLVRFEVFKIPTTLLELLVYGLFLLWFINKGYKGILGALNSERLLIWGILLLLLGVSIATLFSWNLRLSAGIWKAWFIDPILFFVVLITVIKKEDIDNIFKSLIYSGFVVSIISLIYLFLGKFNYQGRLQGIFDSPNFLAMYLAPVLIILMTRIVFTKNYRRILYLVSCFPFLIVLFFTKSFGVLLGILAVIGFGVIVYLYNKNKHKLVLGIVILTFVIFLIFGIIKTNSSEGLSSFNARFVIWNEAINIFKQYPLTGIGPGTFQDYFPPYPKWGVPQPHNIFLAFLIQTGLIGFIGFILILIWFFHPSRKASDDKLCSVKLLLMMLMVCILAHGLVDTTYWKNDLSIIFWIIIGLRTILSRP